MTAEYDAFTNLAKRIDKAFSEIDSEICTLLRETDAGYTKMWREGINLQQGFPAVPQFLEGTGAVSLSAEEHAALLRYLYLKNEMENVERKQIYFRGHTDNFAYLKRIDAV